jgi:hypothetical protein
MGQQFLPGTHTMISRLPFAGKGWTRGRDLKRLASPQFHPTYSHGNNAGK